MKRHLRIKKALHRTGSRRVRFSHAAEAGILIAGFIICIFLMRMIFQALFRPLALIESTPVFTGVNGYGTIESYHPEESAVEHLQKEEEKLTAEHKDTSAVHELISSISCKFDQNEDLENGEIITYGCQYDQAAAIKAGYFLKDTDQSFQVSGLRGIRKIDPFEEIHVSLDQQHQLQISFSDRFNHIQINYEYSLTDVNHVHIHLLYSKDEAARAGYRFTCDEKTISLPADYLVFEQDDLAHFSQHQKEALNKAAWDLPLDQIIRKISLYDHLPAGACITEDPVLERWEINADGQLEIIYTVNGYDLKGKHTWEVTAAVDITAVYRDSWQISLKEPYTYNIEKMETGAYYHPDRKYVK